MWQRIRRQTKTKGQSRYNTKKNKKKWGSTHWDRHINNVTSLSMNEREVRGRVSFSRRRKKEKQRKIVGKKHIFSFVVLMFFFQDNPQSISSSLHNNASVKIMFSFSLSFPFIFIYFYRPYQRIFAFWCLFTIPVSRKLK